MKHLIQLIESATTGTNIDVYATLARQEVT